MKFLYSLLLIPLLLLSCANQPVSSSPKPAAFQTTSLRTFIFGHSLLNHELQKFPTPSQETSVPHWMYLLASEAGYSFNASGQYGFLPQHAQLPPSSQWGFDLFEGVWDSETQSFKDAEFNSILMTAANFIQWQAPNEHYPNENISPIEASLSIIDWVHKEQPKAIIYIYENWPEMAQYMQSFPPSKTEFSAYNAYTLSDFHNWWLDYQDMLTAARLSVNIRMIPVGPILAKVISSTALSEIPIAELYEDDAPHGRATLYFLAALVTYMAMYQSEAPASFQAPDIIHAAVNQNYPEIVALIWAELQAFKDQDGNSRVW